MLQSLKVASGGVAVCTALMLGGASAAKANVFFNKEVQLSTTGVSYVGQVNGKATLVHQANNGTCWTIQFSDGSMDEDIDIVGTSGVDMIIVANGSATLCGQAIGKLAMNGHQLNVYGMTGDDYLWNLSDLTGVLLHGGGGNDSILAFSGTATGGPGNDFLGGGQGTALHGNDGNDYFCVPSGVAGLAYGGNGSDSLCGQAFFRASLESELTPPACSCSLF